MKGRPIRDVSGRRFGRLTALYPTSMRYRRSVMWHCRCDCGTEKDISLNCLVQGITRSCGCLLRESRQARPGGSGYIDEMGNTHGALTVLERAPSAGRRAAWRCRCRCGKEVVVIGRDLRRGERTSCGCHHGHFDGRT